MLPRPDPMLRYFIVDILLPLLVFALLRSFFRSLFPARRDVSRQTPPPSQPDVVAGGELKKDPVCGTFVVSSTPHRKQLNGTPYFFCSPECRDKFHG